jgi:hypothetical protein
MNRRGNGARLLSVRFFVITAVQYPFEIEMRYAAALFKALCAGKVNAEIENINYRPYSNGYYPVHFVHIG